MPVQNQTITSTNLPTYAEPYVTEMLDRARDNSYQQYIPFGYTQDASGNVVRATDPTTGQPVNADRIAGFTPGQTYAQQQAYDLQRPEQLGQATDLAGAAGLGSLAASQYAPTSFSYQNVSAPQLQQYQMATPDQFGQAQAQQYMSPYFQNVLDVQKREAITDAQKAQLMTNLGAARQGTYGGARQLLAGTERERALGTNLSDIQAKGLQSAYENAQQQFERDRNAGMSAGQQNLNARMQIQQLGSGQQMQSQLANQQYGMDAQKAAEASRQFGVSSGLQGLAQALQSAQTLGNLGTSQQASDLARIQAQAAAGSEQQALDQRYMDTRYADFLRQRDFPTEQLSYYNSLIRGLPMEMGSTKTTYAPPPSVLGQLANIGIGAYGVSNAFGSPSNTGKS
jgi:hypothetical protein